MCDKKTENRVTSYEDIFEKFGFGHVQWIVLISGGLVLLSAMSEIIGMGVIAIASQCDLKLSSADKGILTGVGIIGNISSSYFWGYLSDTIGRRPILLKSILATSLFSMASLFAPNFGIFILFRFFVGLSISGATTVIYAYVGEFFTAKYRPIVINYVSLFIAISIVYVPVVAWLVLLMDWSVEISSDFSLRPWRLLPLFNVFPLFLSALLLLYLPESPKILLSLGRDKEAYDCLDWICKKNLAGRALHEIIAPIKENSGPMFGIEKKKSSEEMKNCFYIFRKMWQEITLLFQCAMARHFVICCCVMSSVYMCSIGMGIWYPQIQNRLGLHASDDNVITICAAMSVGELQATDNSTVKVCNDTVMDKTYRDNIFYGVANIVGYIVLGTVINLLGRKAILVSFLGIAGACGIALLWIVEPLGIVVSFSLFLVLAELCMSILNGIVVDLVPTHLCGQAVCICLTLGRLSAFIATYLIGSIIGSHCMLTFLLFSGFSILCAILSAFLPT